MKRKKFNIDIGTPEDIVAVTNSREFRACTAKQKAFVLDLLATGDARHALDAAYPKTSNKSRRSLLWQVLRAEAVVNFLELWKWRDTENARGQLINIVREQLAASEPGSVAAQRFAVQLERLILGLIPIGRRPIPDPVPNEVVAESEQPGPAVEQAAVATTQKFYVGQRITERDSEGTEHVGIVCTLDADGRPDHVEEYK